MRFQVRSLAAGVEMHSIKGVKVKVTSRPRTCEQARITVQIDIAFGDRVVPGAKEIDFPTLLDLPRPEELSVKPMACFLHLSR